MSDLRTVAELWHVKMLAGIVLTIFAPIHVAFTILMILIAIDTGTGIAQGLKTRRFSSRHLRKAANKVILYGVCVITTRLLEQGILYFFSTTMISQMVLGFLIVTETLSIIENLILLGIPIPENFVSIILKNIKVFGIEDIVRRSIQDYSENKDIEEIVNYQIPTVKNETVRKLLEIKFEVWSEIVTFIKRHITEDNVSGNEMLYYKVMSIIETGNKEMEEKWAENGIPQECVNWFKQWHGDRVEMFLESTRNICYSKYTLPEKKQDLLDRILTLLYQTIVDVLKGEADIDCEACRCRQ